MSTTCLLLLLMVYSISSHAAISTATIASIAAILSDDKIHPCQQPLQRGNCSEKIPFFYYNNRDQKCRRFMYSGCNGNENRFSSREECQRKCGEIQRFFKKQAVFSTKSLAACMQKFNPRHQKLCHRTAPAWKIRYFYDSHENRCRQFWYGGCKGTGRNRNFFVDEQSCKSLCVRKKRRKPADKQRKNSRLKNISKAACFVDFDMKLRDGCKTFDWRPRFFYNLTSSKCEMFWYDNSCPKPTTITNMFYHRGACKRLCQWAIEPTVHSQQQGSLRRIGHISAMFSQPYSSVRALRSHQKLMRMRNIFHDFVVDARIRHGKTISPKPSKTVRNHTAVIGIVPKQVTLVTMKTSEHPHATVSSYEIKPKMLISPETVLKPRVIPTVVGYLEARLHTISDSEILTTTTSSPLRVRVTQAQISDVPTRGGVNDDFEVQISRAEFRRSLQKISPGALRADDSNNDDTVYDFDQFMQITSKAAECGDFDPKLADACGVTDWTPRYYFDTKSGQCRTFWSSGCASDSQNNFENIASCQWRCEVKQSDSRANTSAGMMFPNELASRCLEPLAIGGCVETYPAYYYDREMQDCQPFMYSGCGGNSNRFLTLRQCQTTCNQFRGLSPLETNCLLPLDGGERTEERQYVEEAGIRYYYDQNHERCERFWYSGYGGNENRFYEYTTCEAVCRNVPAKFIQQKVLRPEVCFQPITQGKCRNSSRKSLQRWAYNDAKLQCVTFIYSGCGGNQNRFATEYACNVHCKGLIRPMKERCIAYPEWGNCNQLRYQWFYNLTKGTCEQFLWGGCNDGNENRFDTFETCQRICEVPAENICEEPLDRGKWCEPMSNRYYYNANTKTCKGFHYTGCGKSSNMFMTQSECEEKCINPGGSIFSIPSSASVSSGQVKYRGVKPAEKQAPIMHKILIADTAPYIKTDGQWLDYGQCVGYRYNITGDRTRLTSYLCSMERDGACRSQILSSTNGEEKCRLVQPWLRGMHLYSWFFTVDRRPYPTNKQALNETIAALIILPPNDCHSMC